MMLLTVCTFLWHDPQGVRNDIYVYDESHVHRLKRMVEKNLSLEHEFICVSDRKIDGVNVNVSNVSPVRFHPLPGCSCAPPSSGFENGTYNGDSHPHGQSSITPTP